MVVTSVASPVSPRYASPYEKILGKLLETVRACIPSLRSQPIATQSLPTLFTSSSALIGHLEMREHIHSYYSTAIYAEGTGLMMWLAR